MTDTVTELMRAHLHPSHSRGAAGSSSCTPSSS